MRKKSLKGERKESLEGRQGSVANRALSHYQMKGLHWDRILRKVQRITKKLYRMREESGNALATFVKLFCVIS